MRRSLPRALTALACAGCAAIDASAGRVWCEFIDGGADAGAFVDTAQVPSGNGILLRIDGSLAAAAGAGGDFEDMYLVFIEDPNTFRATTDPVDPVLAGLLPGASFDTQLWLFRREPTPLAAFGALGNNNTPLNPNPFSLLVPVPTDGSPPIDECGLYLLAISGVGDVPTSSGGIIFAIASPTEISGPDGPGGAFAHSGWTPAPVAGTYAIALMSVRFPGPCLEDCNGSGFVDIADLLALLGGWGTTRPCPCDFDGGGVGITDLLSLIAAWNCM